MEWSPRFYLLPEGCIRFRKQRHTLLCRSGKDHRAPARDKLLTRSEGQWISISTTPCFGTMVLKLFLNTPKSFFSQRSRT